MKDKGNGVKRKHNGKPVCLVRCWRQVEGDVSMQLLANHKELFFSSICCSLQSSSVFSSSFHSYKTSVPWEKSFSIVLQIRYWVIFSSSVYLLVELIYKSKRLEEIFKSYSVCWSRVFSICNSVYSHSNNCANMGHDKTHFTKLR